MGYTLKIGEAKLVVDEDYATIDCETHRSDDAPAFGDPTDFESERWPSYSAWFNAMETLGLVDVMFNERNKGAGEFEWNGKHRMPLIPCHPGVCGITPEHVQYVQSKLDEYKKKHPDHRAEYPPPKPGAKPIFGTSVYRKSDYVDDPTYDDALCRGEWLIYWLRWALEHCERPVFVNS